MRSLSTVAPSRNRPLAPGSLEYFFFVGSEQGKAGCDQRRSCSPQSAGCRIAVVWKITESTPQNVCNTAGEEENLNTSIQVLQLFGTSL